MRLLLSFLLGIGASQAFLLPMNHIHTPTKLYNAPGGFMDQYKKAMEKRKASGGEAPAPNKPIIPKSIVPKPVPVSSTPDFEFASVGSTRTESGKTLFPTKAEDYQGFVDEEGEEEGVMEIGVSLADTDMLAFIPGMHEMTKEQYEKAVNDKAIKALEEVRKRRSGGDYMNSLKKRPQPPKQQ